MIMNNNLYKDCLLALLAFGGLTACRDTMNELRDGSVVKEKQNQSDLDHYIEQEFTKPYNIEVYYRYKESEISRNWVTSPARESNSIQFINVMKYLFLQPYEQLMGKDFVRRFSPQALVLNGTLGYNPPPANTNTKASTVNGVKIVFMNMNNFDFPTMKDEYARWEEYIESDPSWAASQKAWLDGINNGYLAKLKDSYLRTVFHESAHTFHQRVEYSRDFDKISNLDYKQANAINGWTSDGKNSLHYGFISNYASQEPHEDFAELFGNYIVLTPEEWDARLASADVIPEGRTLSGKAIIEKKLEFMRTYMQNQWHLDIDSLRKYVQSRYPEFARQDFSQIHLNK